MHNQLEVAHKSGSKVHLMTLSGHGIGLMLVALLKGRLMHWLLLL